MGDVKVCGSVRIRMGNRIRAAWTKKKRLYWERKS